MRRVKVVGVGGVSCPFCGCRDVFRIVGTDLWYCKGCHRQFRNRVVMKLSDVVEGV